jgi:hypothetical protein
MHLCIKSFLKFVHSWLKVFVFISSGTAGYIYLIRCHLTRNEMKGIYEIYQMFYCSIVFIRHVIRR